MLGVCAVGIESVGEVRESVLSVEDLLSWKVEYKLLVEENTFYSEDNNFVIVGDNLGEQDNLCRKVSVFWARVNTALVEGNTFLVENAPVLEENVLLVVNMLLVVESIP